MQIEVTTWKVVSPLGKETGYVVIGTEMETKVVIQIAPSTFNKACKLLGIADEMKETNKKDKKDE